MRLALFVWQWAIRRIAPRQQDAFAGRNGRPNWSIILRRGIVQGFIGGSKPWIVLGGLAAVIRVVYKLGEGDGEVILTEVLKAGESVLVSDTGIERRADR